MTFKATCTKCGLQDEPRWVWSGLCQDCWWEPHVTETPAVAHAGTDLTPHACVFCGRQCLGGELCTRCDSAARDLDQAVIR